MNGTSSGYDDYWRLPTHSRATAIDLRDFLLGKGYDVKKSDPKYKLIELRQRVHCGRVCYDSCSLVELTNFARDRGVDLRGATAKKAIIVALNRADNAQTFDGFMQLPPELRNRIYDYYLLHFAPHQTLPTMPPLARTCKQLKLEVYPLFLATKTVGFIFERESLSMTKNSPRIRPTPMSDLFFNYAKESFCEIRSFSIEARRWWRRSAGGEDYKAFCYIKIELDQSGTSFQITTSNDLDCADPERTAKRKMLRKAFSKIMEDVAKRDTTQKLKVVDIYNLRKAMETVFK